MLGYRIFGLALASGMPLPGVHPSRAASDAADIVVRLAEVPSQLSSPLHSGPNWQFTADEFLIHIPGIARFLLWKGKRIDVAAETGVAMAEVAPFLTGSVLGILLHQRSHLALRASAVAVDGRAVLFCGPSGSGKSTLAAALVAQGFPLICDDLCAIDMRDGVALAHSDATTIKLWDETVRRLGLEESRGDRIREPLLKFHVAPALRCADALPVKAVYLLAEDRPPRTFGIERPVLPDAARLLRAHSFRPPLVRRMEQHMAYFKAAAAISMQGGIHQLFRPARYDALPATIERLRSHWASL